MGLGDLVMTDRISNLQTRSDLQLEYLREDIRRIRDRRLERRVAWGLCSLAGISAAVSELTGFERLTSGGVILTLVGATARLLLRRDPPIRKRHM